MSSDENPSHLFKRISEEQDRKLGSFESFFKRIAEQQKEKLEIIGLDMPKSDVLLVNNNHLVNAIQNAMDCVLKGEYESAKAILAYINDEVDLLVNEIKGEKK